MKRFSNFLVKIANWKTSLAFFLVYISFNAYFLPKGFKSDVPIADRNLPIIDLQMTYNPENVKSIVSMYSGKAKEAYILNSAIVDTIYPMAYVCFFGILLSLVFYKWKIRPWFLWLNVLPVGILIFDYLENIMIISMLKTYPANIDTLAMCCSFFTMVKWSLAGVVILLLLTGIATNLLKART